MVVGGRRHCIIEIKKQKKRKFKSYNEERAGMEKKIQGAIKYSMASTASIHDPKIGQKSRGQGDKVQSTKHGSIRL